MTLYFSFFISLNVYIMLKVLTQDWKPRLKEIAFVLFAGALVAIVITLSSDIGTPLIDLALILLLLFYFYKVKLYSVKKSLILAFTLFTLFIIQIAIFVAFAAFTYSDATEISSIAADPSSVPLPILGLSGLLLCILSFIFTALFVKLSQRLRKAINQSERLQTILLCAMLFVFVSFQLIEFLASAAHSFAANAIFFVAYAGIALISFVFYIRSLQTKLKAKYELQQKEAEQESLRRYTEALERQQTAVLKFKHDYLNILTSLRAFLAEDDLVGLKQYYSSNIEAVSQTITSDDLALESLSKIKVREIKSILAAKLMLAQTLGIPTTFEANEDIDSFHIDSIALVRMLGILLDNAIEALTELGSGNLRVGCFKEEAQTILIVQNTCRPDMPELHRLWETGFSTKGEHRGLGLANLSELSDSHPNVTRETEIAEGHFTQKLMIGTKR